MPPAQAGAPGTFTFNNGDGSTTTSNPYPLDRVLQAPTPKPFNVTRLKPIHPSTQQTNDAYHAALDKGSIWQFYQLVMTQWPIVPNSPSTQGTPDNTFPGTSTEGNKTASANVTLETFDQGSVFMSCMACHNATMKPTDFLWSLNDHAYPPSSATPNLMMRNASFRALRNLLEQREERDVPAAARKKEQ